VNSFELETLAAFRYQMRKFLRFSKDLLTTEDLTPDQYQALVAIRACCGNGRLSIRDLAEQLQVRHHSTVGIVDQLVNRGAVVREVAPDDRRKILLTLTPKGEEMVNRLAPPHHQALSRLCPEMILTLRRICGDASEHDEDGSSREVESYSAAATMAQ
jgi:DNA-binding MarR family transcriptional regulator